MYRKNLGYILTKNNDGMTLLKEGDTMIQSQLAKTLEAIMHSGADALYKGKIAKMMVKDIADAGGIITLDDIVNYRPVLVSLFLHMLQIHICHAFSHSMTSFPYLSGTARSCDFKKCCRLHGCRITASKFRRCGDHWGSAFSFRVCNAAIGIGRYIVQTLVR